MVMKMKWLKKAKMKSMKRTWKMKTRQMEEEEDNESHKL